MIGGNLVKKKLDLLLDRAKKLEKGYDWLCAADFYKKAAGLTEKMQDSLKAANIHDRIGYCFYRAAQQAETNNEFRRRMKLSIKAYQSMNELLQKLLHNP